MTLARPDAPGDTDTLLLSRTEEDTGPVLLLVPAMGIPAGYYRPFLDAVATAGVHAAAVDLPQARGRPVDRFLVPGGYTELAEGVVAAARVRLDELLPDAGPTVLLGHSMGGHVTLLHAAHRPATLAGMVLLASGTTHWRSFGRRGPLVLAQTQAVAVVSAVLGYWPGHRFGFGGRQPRSVVRDWARLARTGRLDPASTELDAESALAKVVLPVLAVDVAGDRLAPARSVEDLLAKVPLSDVTRLHHDEHGAGSGHFRWARQPGSLADTVAGWVSSVATTGPEDHLPR